MFQRRIVSIPAFAGAVAVLAVDVVYLNFIVNVQRDAGPGLRVPFVALWLFACGAAGLVASFATSNATRAVLFGASAAGLFVLGVPAAFSIGIPLVICAGLIGGAAIYSARQLPMPGWVPLLAGAVFLLGASGLLWIGFALTR